MMTYEFFKSSKICIAIVPYTAINLFMVVTYVCTITEYFFLNKYALLLKCIFHQARDMYISKIVFPVNRLHIQKESLLLSADTLTDYAIQYVEICIIKATNIENL